MRRPLFVCYGGGHVGMVIPVVQEMQRRGEWDPVVLGLTTARIKLDAAGIPSLGFQDILLPTDTRAIEVGQQLMAHNHANENLVSPAESQAYLGLCYADLEQRLGVVEAQRQYSERQRHAFLPLGPLRRALRKVNPTVVIATNAPKSERAAIMVAQEMDIPCACIIDLFGLEWDFLFAPDYADKSYVMSPTVRDDFIQRGRRRQDVIMTGNPAFDRLADPSFVAASHEWKRQTGQERKRIVLWADTFGFSYDHRLAVLRALADCAKQHPDWSMLYRPHPNITKDLPPLPEGVQLADTRVELPIQLHAADVVLGTISTCSIEAALLDKPVLKLQFIDPNYSLFSPNYVTLDRLSPYEQMGIAWPVRRLEDIHRGIECCLIDSAESRSMVQARRNLPKVGSAAARVVDAIEDLLTEKSKFRKAEKAA